MIIYYLVMNRFDVFIRTKKGWFKYLSVERVHFLMNIVIIYLSHNLIDSLPQLP